MITSWNPDRIDTKRSYTLDFLHYDNFNYSPDTPYTRFQKSSRKARDFLLSALLQLAFVNTERISFSSTGALLVSAEVELTYIQKILLLGFGVSLAVGKPNAFSDNDSNGEKQVENTANDASGNNYKQLDKKELQNRLGTKDIHGVKNDIIKDFGKELKDLGWKNPDIAVDSSGNVVLIDRITGQSFNTNVPLELYKP